MKVLVTGGRHFADYHAVGSALLDVHEAERITQIIHGGATGADELAGRWARANNIPVHVFPANWKSLGRAAGPMRNAEMLIEGQPDLVIALPGGTGTADMVRRARAAGVRVLEVT